MNGQYLSRLKHRKKDVSVSLQDLWDTWLKQEGRCAYTGVPLDLIFNDRKKLYSTASLDRIDSSRGYEPGNIQWVHKRINVMKNDMPEEEFVRWCALVASNGKGGSCGI